MSTLAGKSIEAVPPFVKYVFRVSKYAYAPNYERMQQYIHVLAVNPAMLIKNEYSYAGNNIDCDCVANAITTAKIIPNFRLCNI